MDNNMTDEEKEKLEEEQERLEEERYRLKELQEQQTAFYNHVADVPRLLGGGFHSDFQ